MAVLQFPPSLTAAAILVAARRAQACSAVTSIGTLVTWPSLYVVVCIPVLVFMRNAHAQEARCMPCHLGCALPCFCLCPDPVVLQASVHVI